MSTGIRFFAHALAAGAAALCLAPPALRGQGVTGVVRDSATAAPLAGVLVSAIGADDVRVRSTLSDDAGRFTVAVPLGRYRIEAERIGLRPAATGLFDVRTLGLHREDVVMTDRAVEIAGLVVDARVQSCRLDPEGAVRIQRWWLEIRTALDVSSVLQQERFAEYRVERVEREWDADLRRIVASNRRVEVSTSSRPFVSEDAELLAEGGFIQGDLGGQRQYYAPDADVLLSDLFLSQHCFSLVGGGERKEWLGLRFEPVRERAVPDIVGTLWVDTTTAELQSMEFRYANVADIPPNESGGKVTFEVVPSGAWIVSEWYIRMPKLALDERGGRRAYEVLGYVDVGGEVTPMALDRAPDVAGLEGAIRGTVFDSIRGVGLPDARVSILGTRFAATTDEAGQFIITNVPVGRHDLTFTHPDPEAWGLGSGYVEVRVREKLTASAELAIPGFRQAALTLCLGEGADAAAVFIGRLLDRDRRPMRNVDVELAWAPVEPEEGAGTRPARTGSDGRLVVCTLPPGRPLTLRARIGERWVDALEITLPPLQITYREVWFTG